MVTRRSVLATFAAGAASLVAGATLVSPVLAGNGNGNGNRKERRREQSRNP